ncbi:MAG: VOC family protein [Burkholderiaceae bacterium]
MANSYRTPSDIHPCLTYRDAPAAIDWLCRAFGFTKRFAVADEDGRIQHSELSLGTGVIMVSSLKPEGGQPANASAGGSCLSVFVADPAAHHRQAQSAGAQIVRELRTEDYGATGYMARDPEGNLWYFGDYRPGEYWESSPPAQQA